MNRNMLRGAVALGLTALAMAAGQAVAQEKLEMKLAYYVGDQHAMSQWLVRWSETLEKRSGGRISVKRFPGATMGPTPGHYDFARTGQADVSWFLHGGTPGRFPLTEIVNLPFLVGSAEIGTKVLNDAELRSKWLDAEHKGTRVLMLFTHQPGGPHMSKKPIRTLDDFKGQRIRFASPTVREFIQALGATPVGVSPTEVAEQLQKGTLDGAFMDYGGVGIAFKLGGIVKYSTDMYSFVTSFGLVMNEDFWKKLGPEGQRLVMETTTGKEKEIGEAWDGLDAPGKKAVVDGGGQVIRPAPEEMAKFRKIAADLSEAHVKQLEAKGLTARQVYATMKALAEKHAKTSKNFWD